MGDDLGVCVLNLKVVQEKKKIKTLLIKESCDFVRGRTLRYVITLAGLVTIGIVIAGI